MTVRALATLSLLLVFVAVAPAQRLGFVDIEEAIVKYDKTATITRELEDSLKETDGILRSRLQRLEQQKKDIDAIDDPVEKLTRLKEIRQQEEELKIDQEYTLVSLEQRLAAHIAKVYSEVLELVAAVARERGLTAVFMFQSSAIEGQSQDSVKSAIIVRPVLWHEPNLDLTTEIIRRLNK